MTILSRPLVLKARSFAENAHKGQMYGDEPYTYHLNEVANTLITHGFDNPETDEVLIQGAYLHDSVEDTDVTMGELMHEFGRNVARLVFAVTNELGKNRKERAERTYPKIFAAGREATALKLADRISNVKHSLTYNHDLFDMYRKEYEGFKKALRIQGELKELWAVLDNLVNTKIEDIK